MRSAHLQIDFSTRFETQRKNAPRNVRIAFREVFEIFLEDPHNRVLRNHMLRGRFAGIRSIDITGDWRALYREEKHRIVFLLFGTHSQLYK